MNQGDKEAKRQRGFEPEQKVRQDNKKMRKNKTWKQEILSGRLEKKK